jgi:hypothetical protein
MMVGESGRTIDSCPIESKSGYYRKFLTKSASLVIAEVVLIGLLSMTVSHTLLAVYCSLEWRRQGWMDSRLRQKTRAERVSELVRKHLAVISSTIRTSRQNLVKYGNKLFNWEPSVPVGEIRAR